MSTYPEEFKALEEENKRLQAENERLEEWQKAILGKIKRWPIYDKGKWVGDKEGWGYIFELIGWSERIRIELQAENEMLRKVILLAPGSNEKEFRSKYNKWWDVFYREIRSPGCNLKNIEQALNQKD